MNHVDYEIIEVNGFAIKRRKSERKPETTTPTVKPLVAVDQQTVQRTPNVEEYEISAELYNRLTETLHEYPESAPASSRLLAVCSCVCAAEIDTVKARGDEEVASALEVVFGDFMDGIAKALDNESIRMAPVVDVVDEDFKVDVASRKVGLLRRLEILEKEEKEWAELLEKMDGIHIDPPVQVDESQSVRLAEKEIKELQELHENIQKQVSMQVEGVSLVVGNIEDLIEKANRKALDAQKNLHSKRYQAYPHVNSPARLIRAIVRPDA
jgi:hypothetical protein